MASVQCVPESGCTIARVFLTLSALSAFSSGLAILLVPDMTVELIRTTMLVNFEASPEICQLLGCMLLGWGAGKAATVLTGTDEAITMFCSLNLVPMAIAVLSTLPPAGKPWLFLLIMLCYVYCAVTGPRHEMATSTWSAGQAFLAFSACCVTVQGLFILIAPKLMDITPAFGEVDGSVGMLLGACAFGWAVGKWSCLYNGDVAIHLLCKINLLPMLALIITSSAQHNTPACTLAVSIALGYLFLGLSGPPTADDFTDAQLPRMLSSGRYGHMNTKIPDTSKLPYVAQRRPSFEFLGNVFEERKGSKDSPSLKEPLIDAEAAEPVRQTSSGSSSGGKFAGLSRLPSKEAAALSKQPTVPVQKPAFQFLKT